MIKSQEEKLQTLSNIFSISLLVNMKTCKELQMQVH